MDLVACRPRELDRGVQPGAQHRIFEIITARQQPSGPRSLPPTHLNSDNEEDTTDTAALGGAHTMSTLLAVLRATAEQSDNRRTTEQLSSYPPTRLFDDAE